MNLDKIKELIADYSNNDYCRIATDSLVDKIKSSISAIESDIALFYDKINSFNLNAYYSNQLNFEFNSISFNICLVVETELSVNLEFSSLLSGLDSKIHTDINFVTDFLNNNKDLFISFFKKNTELKQIENLQEELNKTINKKRKIFIAQHINRPINQSEFIEAANCKKDLYSIYYSSQENRLKIKEHSISYSNNSHMDEELKIIEYLVKNNLISSITHDLLNILVDLDYSEEQLDVLLMTDFYNLKIKTEIEEISTAIKRSKKLKKIKDKGFKEIFQIDDHSTSIFSDFSEHKFLIDTKNGKPLNKEQANELLKTNQLQLCEIIELQMEMNNF